MDTSIDTTNDTTNDSIDNDPYVIAFKISYHCLPVHNYIINVVSVGISTVIYYCGNNNTITLSLEYVKNKIQESMSMI